MNGKFKLKGKMLTHLLYPVILGLMAVCIGVYVYVHNMTAGLVILGAGAVYVLVALIMYFLHKPVVMHDLINFAVDYAKVQKVLLRDLAIPYGLMDIDGNILWLNKELEALFEGRDVKGQNVSEIFTERTVEDFVSSEERKEFEMNYHDRAYSIVCRRINVSDVFTSTQVLSIEDDRDCLVAFYMFDETENRRLLKENSDQRLVAGLIYIDNYEKMEAVQKVLVEKERQATYMRDGYSVVNRNININLYTKGSDGVLRYDGQTLEGDMHRAAETHFAGHTVTRQSINQDLPVYYFSTSYDPDNLFAVYLKGTTPYVSYATSQGVYQATMDWITKETDFENFFDEDQWIRLSPFIREDEFSDSNFLLTGYESEEERLEICKELFESANKELNTLCQPSLEFSMEMANILALPEFKSLIDQFQLGNFVRVHIREDYVKRARLLEVHLNFNDLSDFNCSFGNLITTKSEIDKHAELLSQAVTAGKQVATSAGDWQRAVDKSSKLEEEIANGLQNAALEVGRASGQSIVWDSSGIWGRKLIDGTADQYEDEQFRIINNKLVFSNDGFKTSKSVMGRFVVKDDNGNDVTRWGLLAEAMVGGYIEGSEIRGGNLRIGDGSNNYFQVDESGNVSIFKAGKEKYASVDAVNEIDNAYRFHIVLSYDKSTVFSDIGQDCTITCKVYDYNTDITDKVITIGGTFSWTRISTESENDIQWNTEHIQTGKEANIIKVGIEDVIGNSHFACSVDFDENQLPSDETNS